MPVVFDLKNWELLIPEAPPTDRMPLLNIAFVFVAVLVMKKDCPAATLPEG